MMLTVLAGSIFAVALAGLIAGAVVIRRQQRAMNSKREAAQLERRADHLFKIALAAHVHTREASIARTLLAEATSVLEYSLQLDPDSEPSAKSLRECHDLLVSIDAEPKHNAAAAHDVALEFPETELIEAQMHLTEAMRLLIGLEKRGRIDYAALAAMTTALKQAQRAIDLRLQLQRAAQALEGERNPPRLDDAALAREYLAALERNQAQPPH